MIYNLGNFILHESLEPVPNYDFRECLLFEVINDVIYYVDINNDSRFDCVNFTIIPKELKAKKKKKRYNDDPDEEIIEEETTEQKIYRQEYNSFSFRKNSYFPIWKLHTNTISKIIERLNNV